MNNDRRRLERNTDDKMIAGVASGVADFFDLDTSIVRIVWALSVLLGGFGAVVYIVMWIVLPESGQERSVAYELREAVASDVEESEDTTDVAGAASDPDEDTLNRPTDSDSDS